MLIYYSTLTSSSGYWSAGTRLADSVRVAGDGVESGEFPEYTASLFYFLEPFYA